MKSVGEVMAIGRTFQESVQKALRGLEVDSAGFEHQIDVDNPDLRAELVAELTNPGAERIWFIADAFRAGMSVDEVYRYSGVDPWFLVQIEDIVATEDNLKAVNLADIDTQRMRRLKRKVFADARLAVLLACTEQEVREPRHQQ
jgi:carbamoyl-phosphate synthase large subunit